MEYINCLSNSKAPYAINKIAQELKEINEFIDKEYEDDEDVDENIKEYHLFLLRRFVYNLIDVKDYERAENFIKRCISGCPELRDFMQEELDYLNSL